MVIPIRQALKPDPSDKDLLVRNASQPDPQTAEQDFNPTSLMRLCLAKRQWTQEDRYAHSDLGRIVSALTNRPPAMMARSPDRKEPNWTAWPMTAHNADAGWQNSIQIREMFVGYSVIHSGKTSWARQNFAINGMSWLSVCGVRLVTALWIHFEPDTEISTGSGSGMDFEIMR